MNFPSYKQYKDSGVNWLGKVPEHWGVEPFKRQIERNDGGVWGDDPDGLGDTLVLRSTEQTADGRWQITEPAYRRLSESEIGGSLLMEGDLLLTKSSGSSLHIGKTTLVTSEIAAMRCCYSNFMQRIRTKQSFSPKLAWHLLNNDLARIQFALLSNSTTGLANLNGSMIGQIVIPVPPIGEQSQIATFLDYETAKIDALILEHQRLIELLKEKRQAVISHAVTKGLNPDAPMRDSGIEWLGEVPAHWRILRLKHMTSKIGSGKTPLGGSEVYVDQGVLFLRSQNVHDDGLRLDDAVYIHPDTDEMMDGTRVLAGDILLNVTGASIGRSCLVLAPFPIANVNQHVCIIRLSTNEYQNFVALVMKSRLIKSQVDVAQTGAAREGLNFEQIGGFVFAIPPSLEETKSICNYVESEIARIDALCLEAECAVQLLQDRRAALILSAVTGKIDVRGLADKDAA